MFEIRYSAFCYMGYSIGRNITNKGEVLGEILCVAGAPGAIFYSYFPHLYKSRNFGGCALSLSPSCFYIFVNLFVLKAEEAFCSCSEFYCNSGKHLKVSVSLHQPGALKHHQPWRQARLSVLFG